MSTEDMMSVLEELLQEGKDNRLQGPALEEYVIDRFLVQAASDLGNFANDNFHSFPHIKMARVLADLLCTDLRMFVERYVHVHHGHILKNIRHTILDNDVQEKNIKEEHLCKEKALTSELMQLKLEYEKKVSVMKSDNVTLNNQVSLLKSDNLKFYDLTTLQKRKLENEPELLTILDKLVVDPNEICGFMFDDCGDPYNPLADWNVTFPSTPQPPPVHPTLPKPGSPTLRVLHLTDVHFDPEYQVGSNANCGEPLCCRDGTGTLADGSDGAGQFGDYRNCDTPLWTLEDMFKTLAAQNSTFDYIIWTGDVPAHNVWNQSRADQINVINKVVSLILKYFPGKTVYPSLGNHESSPVNSFPPPYITGENSIAWLYDALADGWKNWLPQDALDSIRRGAYYTVSPYPGFRIISLNMNYCNNQNWWMLFNTTDPAGELQWLIVTLQKAEDINEKVHILGHIPPGSGACLKSWSWNYYKIVSRYQNTIAGQFFGHTHKDEIEIFYDVETLQIPVGVAYIAPSVTPYSGLNMGYRFYSIDGAYANSSYQVLDHETFYLNVTKANTEGKTKWEFEYSAKSAYNLPSVYARDWNNLINIMKTNNTVLQMYNKFYSKSVGSGACDDDCQNSLLCNARSARSHDPSLCKDFFKREQDFEDMLRRERRLC